jgi:hypothetical protein
MEFTVPVDKFDIEKCYQFAKDLYHNDAASAKQFGTAEKRSENDFIADHVRGKAVEFGFRTFLERNFGISFEVDCNVYHGHLNTDGGNDLGIVLIEGVRHSIPHKIDIKGVRTKAQWLLVEKHKFWAEIYVVGKLTSIPDGEEFERNPERFLDQEWMVTIQGYVQASEIVHPKDKLPWFAFQKGDRLYSSRVIRKLRHEKQRLRPSQFRHRLTEVVRSIQANAPNTAVYIGDVLDCEYNYGYPLSWLRNTADDWQRFKHLLLTKSQKIVP